ncbi:hypothetical protein [Pseudoalteromonas sp. P1-7a]|uniref:hypothetical protein n=1 Tax=Pseudoalteromonas sp. P1-7a TaxID=1723755 RepID=UPI0006D685B9|nr:hypothetical protein [Pseudoalteromonas sp. P1-7a]KPZ60350.1 hypothetical protein AN389_02448 [Pseudoalteromonas sp. P1-7a]
MSDTNHFSERLREPLNETTRKVRRNLMAASVIGVVITKVGLVPTKISAFGVEFTSSNQQALMLLLAAAIAYFAISFLVYVYSELTAWQIVITSKEIEELREISEKERSSVFGSVEEDKFRDHVKHIYFKSKPTFYIRLGVELAIPIIFAIYSCIALLNVNIPVKGEVPVSVQEPTNKSSKKDAQTTRASS